MFTSYSKLRIIGPGRKQFRKGFCLGLHTEGLIFGGKSGIKKSFGNELLRNKLGLTYGIINVRFFIYWSTIDQALKFLNKSTKTHFNFLHKTNITSRM